MRDFAFFPLPQVIRRQSGEFFVGKSPFGGQYILPRRRLPLFREPVVFIRSANNGTNTGSSDLPADKNYHVASLSMGVDVSTSVQTSATPLLVAQNKQTEERVTGESTDRVYKYHSAEEVISLMNARKRFLWGEVSGNGIKELDELVAVDEGIPASFVVAKELKKERAIFRGRNLEGLYQFLFRQAKEADTDIVAYLHALTGIIITFPDVVTFMSIPNREREITIWDKFPEEIYADLQRYAAKELGISTTRLTANLLRNTRFSFLKGNTLNSLAQHGANHRDKKNNETSMQYLARIAGLPDPIESPEAHRVFEASSKTSQIGSESMPIDSAVWVLPQYYLDIYGLPLITTLEILKEIKGVGKISMDQNDYYRKDQERKTFLDYYNNKPASEKEYLLRHTAARIFSDWRTWVGDDIANDFPALTALYTLRKYAELINAGKEVTLHKTIGNGRLKIPIISEDDSKKTKKLKNGLIKLVNRILATGLDYDEIVFAGFELITAAYEDIREEVKTAEIKGILALPEVDCKFVPKSRDAYLYETQRESMGSLLLSAYRSITKPDEKDVKKENNKKRRDVKSIIGTLSNPELGFEDSMFILDTSNRGSIYERYRKIIDGIHIRKMSETKRGNRPSPEQGIIKAAHTLEQALTLFGEEGLSSEAQTVVAGVIERAQGKIGEPAEGETLEQKIIATAQDLEEALRDLDEDKSVAVIKPALESAIRQAQQLGIFVDITSTVGEITRRDDWDILPILAAISHQASLHKAQGGSVPGNIIKEPYQIFNANWEQYRACRNDLDAVNVDGLINQRRAILKFCRGCLVRMECETADFEIGITALENVRSRRERAARLEEVIQGVRGGMSSDERKHFLYERPDLVKLIVKGVKEARVYQTPHLERRLRGIQ